MYKFLGKSSRSGGIPSVEFGLRAVAELDGTAGRLETLSVDNGRARFVVPEEESGKRIWLVKVSIGADRSVIVEFRLHARRTKVLSLTLVC